MGLISINNNLPLINKFNLTGRGQNPDDIILIQKSTHVESLQKYALELKSRALAKKLQTEEMAKKKGWVIKKSFEDGRTIELKELDPKGLAKSIVDCNDLREGIYFLKVTTNYDSFVQKVILKK